MQNSKFREEINPTRPFAGGNSSSVHSVSIFPESRDFLLLQGKDAVDFLHRLSSNDVASIKKGEYCKTVLLTEKAKIIDVLTVFNEGDKLLLLTGRGNGSTVQAWLQKFIFLEDIQIQSDEHFSSMMIMCGEHALQIASQALEIELFISAPQSYIQIPFLGKRLLLHKDTLGSVPILSLYSSEEILGRLQQHLLTGEQAPSNARLMREEEFVTMRIEQGVPAFGREITDQINPLEAGLESLISYTKGCYIGQEVIARLDAYHKLRLRLTGFILETDSTATNDVGIITLNNETVGWTTSHCWSLTLRKPIALGYLRTSARTDGLTFARSDSSTTAHVHTASLPFVRYTES